MSEKVESGVGNHSRPPMTHGNLWIQTQAWQVPKHPAWLLNEGGPALRANKSRRLPLSFWRAGHTLGCDRVLEMQRWGG